VIAAVVLVLALVVVGGIVGFLVLGGGGSGQCVGVSWNGSYYDYTREYGMTSSQCDAWCASHSFSTNCYYEP